MTSLSAIIIGLIAGFIIAKDDLSLVGTQPRCRSRLSVSALITPSPYNTSSVITVVSRPPTEQVLEPWAQLLPPT